MSSHQTRSRPKLAFVFGAEKSYLVIFGFSVFGRKWIFIFVLFFVFVPQMSFALGRKCYVRNWTITVTSAQVTFVFVFRPKKEFHFRRYFYIPKMKKMHFRSASRPTSNYFRLHPTSMIFKHSTIQLLDSL